MHFSKAINNMIQRRRIAIECLINLIVRLEKDATVCSGLNDLGGRPEYRSRYSGDR